MGLQNNSGWTRRAKWHLMVSLVLGLAFGYID